MFSRKVCQYLESKHADPVHAGKKKSTLHFSNACILQPVQSKSLRFFESHVIVVNLKILRLKILRCNFNQSCNIIFQTSCFEVFLMRNCQGNLGINETLYQCSCFIPQCIGNINSLRFDWIQYKFLVLKKYLFYLNHLNCHIKGKLLNV